MIKTRDVGEHGPQFFASPIILGEETGKKRIWTTLVDAQMRTPAVDADIEELVLNGATAEETARRRR